MSDNLQERNQQVLTNLSELETQENKIYDKLEDASLTSEEKQQLITKLGELSQMRMNMYSGLKDMYSQYEKSASSSNDMLEQSSVAFDILEKQMKESQRKLKMIQAQKIDKMRMVQINTYYGKRYNAHSKMMKTIVLTCIPIIILSILANKGLISTNIFGVISGIILVIGIVTVGLQLLDMSNRSKMNWDEYDWYFDRESAPEVSDSVEENVEDSEDDPWASSARTCVGADCCYDGSTYDEEKNVCVPNNIYEEPVTESFRGLEKYAYNQDKSTSINNFAMPSFASLAKF
jgi:hypothetical protein